MATAVKNKKKSKVDPVALVLDDMIEHVEYLRGYDRLLGAESKKNYTFELDGLETDIQALTGLIEFGGDGEDAARKG